MSNILWHYTTERKLDGKGQLEPTRFGGTDEERPCIVFSTSPDWDPICSATIQEDDGSVRLLSIGETAKRYGNLIRVGVFQQIEVFDWHDFKDLSEIPPQVSSQIYRQAISQGGISNNWFFSFEPVPVTSICGFETFDGEHWKSLKESVPTIDDEIRTAEHENRLEEIPSLSDQELRIRIERLMESPEIRQWADRENVNQDERDIVFLRAKEAGQQWSLENASEDERLRAYDFAKRLQFDFARFRLLSEPATEFVKAVKPDADDWQFWNFYLSPEDAEAEVWSEDEFTWRFICGAIGVDFSESPTHTVDVNCPNCNRDFRTEYLPTDGGPKVVCGHCKKEFAVNSLPNDRITIFPSMKSR